jgi:hypothetical protein
MSHRIRFHHAGGYGSDGGRMLLVAPAGVGVVVDPRMPSEFVGSAEALRASREGTSMRLLASVGADMASLVFQAMEGLLTERTFVRAREISRGPLVVLLGVLKKRRHQAHGSRRHGDVGSGLGSVLRGGSVLLRCLFVVEDTG